MNDTVNTTTTGTPGYSYSNTCGSKLPCGYCMLLNRPCPMQSNTFVTPTWDPNWYKIYCGITTSPNTAEPSSVTTAYNSCQQEGNNG